MSYSAAVVNAHVLTVSTEDGDASVVGIAGGGFAATAWSESNRAVYVPVRVRRRVVAVKMGWVNGTSVSGNVDVGIYTAAGTRLVNSGSTAMSGASTEQIVDVTDTTLTPGLYYFALAVDNTTASIRGISTAAPFAAAVGTLTQSSAFPLPTSATFARTDSLVGVPVIASILDSMVA